MSENKDPNIKDEDTDVMGIDVTPEPTKPDNVSQSINAYDSIIEQQGKQIEALMKQNESLSAQVTKLIESGTQIRDASAGSVADVEPIGNENYREPGTIDDKDDLSLEYLAKHMSRK